MELKKSKEADVERLRWPIGLIGSLFVGSLVLASFSYTSAVPSDEIKDKGQRSQNIEFQQEVKKEEQKQEAPEPTVQQTPPPEEEIETIEDTEIIPVPDVPVPPPLPVDDEEVEEVEVPIVEFPDVEATFPGGVADMKRWIAENMVYPQMAIENEQEGTVYVSFVVELDGSISNVDISRKIDEDLDREAKRVVRQMPKWKAGEAGGKKVRTKCVIPIKFQLN